jgi:hypothetical protein
MLFHIQTARKPMMGDPKSLQGNPPPYFLFSHTVLEILRSLQG